MKNKLTLKYQDHELNIIDSDIEYSRLVITDCFGTASFHLSRKDKEEIIKQLTFGNLSYSRNRNQFS
jgi:hypothetical protein